MPFLNTYSGGSIRGWSAEETASGVFSPFTSIISSVVNFDISSDGSKIALIENVSGQPTLTIRNLLSNSVEYTNSSLPSFSGGVALSGNSAVYFGNPEYNNELGAIYASNATAPNNIWTTPYIIDSGYMRGGSPPRIRPEILRLLGTKVIATRGLGVLGEGQWHAIGQDIFDSVLVSGGSRLYTSNVYTGGQFDFVSSAKSESLASGIVLVGDDGLTGPGGSPVESTVLLTSNTVTTVETLTSTTEVRRDGSIAPNGTFFVVSQPQQLYFWRLVSNTWVSEQLTFSELDLPTVAAGIGYIFAAGFPSINTVNLYFYKNSITDLQTLSVNDSNFGRLIKFSDDGNTLVVVGDSRVYIYKK